MKKIIFVINTLGRAGAETSLIELLRKLSESGKYEISLFVLIPQGELFNNIPENVKLLNKAYSTKSVLTACGKFNIALYIIKDFFCHLTGFKMIPYLISNIREQKNKGRFQFDKLLWRIAADGTLPLKDKYDLAVAYIEGGSAYYVADKINSARKAVFVHIDYEQSGYTPLQDRGCYEKFDKIFCVSSDVKDKFLKVYPDCKEKTSLFSNPFDVEGIRRKSMLDERFDDDYDGFRIVTVGRLHYQKGYDIAIEAAKILSERGRDIRWYVLGDGTEKAELQKRIIKYNLQNSFILMGSRSNPYPYVKQADLYVQPSRYEGKCMAIEEAQILGKPIIASDCTGTRDQILSEKDGILIKLDKDTLAKEIERLMDDEALRKRLSAAVSKKEFDSKVIINELVSLIGDDI